MVIWERIDPPDGRLIGAAGVHDLARTAYIANFAGRNDWSRLGRAMPIGRVFHSDEVVSRDAFRESAFYRYSSNPGGSASR